MKKYHRNFNLNEKERNCQTLLELLHDDSAHSSFWVSAYYIRGLLCKILIFFISSLQQQFSYYRVKDSYFDFSMAECPTQLTARDVYRSQISLKILLSNFSTCQWCWPAMKKDYTTPMNYPYVLTMKRKIL